MRFRGYALVGLVCLAGLAGCESDKPATRAGMALDSAGTATGQAVSNAGVATGNAASRAGNYVDRKVTGSPN